MLQSVDEDKAKLNFVTTIKVYGKQDHPTESHSYLVDDISVGVSSPIGTITINIYTMTLKKLRPLIEYDTRGHMDRRSMMFQEALYIMSRLPNYYNLPTNQLKLYRFGFLKKDKTDFQLIPKDKEETPIADLIGAVDFFVYDLMIVPLSQIPPETS